VRKDLVGYLPDQMQPTRSGFTVTGAWNLLGIIITFALRTYRKRLMNSSAAGRFSSNVG
jgi:hypothetical protein